MGLTTKSAYEVLSDLIEWITARTDKITDFNVGSASRTLSEAIAIQFEEFYFAMKQNVLYAIETAVYDAFGFEKKVAGYATGKVTVAFEEPLPNGLMFPKGTVFCTSSTYGYIYFESTEDHYAEAGLISTVIPVQCKEAGTIGNVPAGAISTIVASNTIVRSVCNEDRYTNGVDEETTSERKKRFQNYIKTLARGTTDAIMYGCMEVEGVAGAWVDDNYIGYVRLYAHDSDGNLPEELRKKIKDNLYNYRAAGIEVEILPIVKKPIDLALRVMIDDEYDIDTYKELLTSLVINYLDEYIVAKDLYMSDVIHAIKNAYEEVVINIQVVQGGDTWIAENELVRAGSVQLTCVKQRDWRS